MNKSISRGSFVLIVSGLVCKLLGAFFRLPLTSILGIEGIGVFQMVMAVYSFALILTSGGFSAALSRLVSQARARGEIGKIKWLLKKSIVYALTFGLGVGLILSLLSKNIAVAQGAEAGVLGYKLMIALIPMGGVISALRGIFQGYENMFPTAISQIIEQIFKFSLGLIFAFILGKFSIAFGVFGGFLGVTAGEIAAIIYLLIYMKVKVKFEPLSSPIAKPMFLQAVLPLSLGASVLPLVGALDSFIVANRLVLAGFSAETATALFGLQTGVVAAILGFPLIISNAISTAILPSISYQDALLSTQTQQKVSQSLKVMWFVLMPLVFGLAAVSRPLYQFVYPSLDENMLAFAVNLTYFGCVSTIITALMQFFVMLLQAKGKFGYCMSAYMLGGAIKIILVYVLCALPAINIYGVVIGNIALASTVAIMALVKNRRKIAVGIYELTLPLLSSLAMTLAIVLFQHSFALSPLLQIICDILIGGVIYLFFTLPVLSDMLKVVFGHRHDELLG